VAGSKECTLLDVGCGPATLLQLQHPNIRYYGIDTALPGPATNLLELEVIENPIAFDGRNFEIVVVQGLFE
jgi:hypothetical protein